MAEHPHHAGVRCFTLVRVDGARVDFSYRKTLNAMLGRPWGDDRLPTLARLQRLVRTLSLNLTLLASFSPLLL